MSGARGFPYWRLAGFYFFYFAALGAFLPYWGLYLESQGYMPQQIGQLMALVAATKIFAPNLWGWLADRTGTGVRLIRLASFATVCSFAGVFWSLGFWWLFLVTLVFSFFWNACLPLFEALTLRHLDRDTHRYSRVRLWGSVGFIVTVGLLGKGLQWELLIDCLPQLVWMLLVAVWLSSLVTPRAGWSAEHDTQRFWRIFSRGEVLAFFVVVMLLQLSHGPYYVFFSIHLADHGFSPDRIGALWALGVAAEIVLFLFIHRLFGQFSLRQVLLTSIALSAVRWLLIAWATQSLGLLLIAQILHAASFGSTHAVGIQLTHRYFTGRNRSRGQGLYSSVSFGLGGALGSLLSGQAWVPLGAARVYSLAAGLCLVSWLIAWIGVDRRIGSFRTVTR